MAGWRIFFDVAASDVLIQSLLLVIKATIILLLALLALRCVRKSSAAIRHGILAAAFIGISILPLLAMGLPGLELPISWIPNTYPASEFSAELPPGIPSPEGMPSKNLEDELPLGTQSTFRESFERQANAFDSRQRLIAISLIWLAGVLTVLSLIALGEIQTWRVRIASTKLTSSPWLSALRTVVRESWLRQIQLRESMHVTVPMTCGTIFPVVLVPVGFSCEESDCKRILLHEVAHIRRFDVAIQTVARVACAFYWFHPLAWHCLHRMRCEREQACDDWVLNSGEDPADYAEQLLEFARTQSRFRALSSAAGITRQGSLTERIEYLLSEESSHKRLGLTQLTLIASLSTSLCVLVATLSPASSIATTRRPDTVVANALEAENNDSNKDLQTPPRTIQPSTLQKTNIAIADFESYFPVFQYVSGFAGYQDADGRQFKLGPQLSFQKKTIDDFGSGESHAMAAIVDTSKLRIPESAKMNFVGCGVGMTLQLTEDISKTELSRIQVSFDAAVRGTGTLRNTKVLVGFAVDKGKFPAGGEGPANANYDDILCKLIKGEQSDDLLNISESTQHFEFNLGEDFQLHAGRLENLQLAKPQRIAFILQAAGNVEDTGIDDDNMIIVDNLQFNLLPRPRR